MVCTVDLAASFASLVGQSLSTESCLDSFNLIDVLLGKHNAQGREHLVQQNNGTNGTYAIRSGNWKLHRYDRNIARNKVVEKKLANTRVPRYQLFNLAEDPQEEKDLYMEKPEVASRLIARLEQLITDGRSRPER